MQSSEQVRVSRRFAKLLKEMYGKFKMQYPDSSLVKFTDTLCPQDFGGVGSIFFTGNRKRGDKRLRSQPF